MNQDEWNDEAATKSNVRYLLGHQDKKIVTASLDLLDKIVRSSFVRPAELVSIGKILHVLRTLPSVTDGVDVHVSLIGPRRSFDDREIYHWWDISVENGLIEIYSGGHFYRKSSGGDTFRCMQWSAEPSLQPDYNDYLDELWMVDDAQPFDQEVMALDLTKPGYSLEVTDNDNPLLDEIADDEEVEDGADNSSI